MFFYHPHPWITLLTGWRTPAAGTLARRNNNWMSHQHWTDGDHPNSNCARKRDCPKCTPLCSKRRTVPVPYLNALVARRSTSHWLLFWKLKTFIFNYLRFCVILALSMKFFSCTKCKNAKELNKPGCRIVSSPRFCCWWLLCYEILMRILTFSLNVFLVGTELWINLLFFGT